MISAAAANVVAVVVGIDHYEYGEPWDLAGPAADALRCADWLMDRGVPPGNITLFLSTQSIRADAEVAAWAAANPDCKPRPATRSNVLDFIDKELPSKPADALFLFWGGHGVADDFEDRNYLYTEDAADRRPYCISTQSLSACLRGQHFSHLAQQVIIVDACANPFSDTGESARPGWASFASTPIDRDIGQVQMFAATRGKIAANISERRSGLFSGALFAEFKRHAGAGWPDFIAAFDATISGVEQLSLAAQQPYILLSVPGRTTRESGVAPRQSPIVASLLDLVYKTSAAPALLYHVYLSSLPDASRGLGIDCSREQWLRDLDDSRSVDAKLPPPLVQFAERLARKLPDASLAIWVDERTRNDTNARDALRAWLDAETAQRRCRATLFIELPERHDELRWWVQSPNPQDCSRREAIALDTPLKEALAAKLPGIVAEAEGVSKGRYDLVVSLIVPDTLLLADLESLKVDFDGSGRPVAFNKRYPVALHWRTRVLAGKDEGSRPVNGWRQALEVLKPRLAKGGGTDVLWLRSATVDDDVDPMAEAWDALTRASGTAICVGVGHVGGAASAMPAEIRGCLTEGVPCFFWLAQPPADESVARQALFDIFARLDACEAPLSIGRKIKAAKRGDLLSLVRIVWDEPGHLPLAHSLQTPISTSEGAST